MYVRNCISTQVYAQNQELRVQLKESKQNEIFLQEQIRREEQRLSELHEKYDKLKSYFSGEEIETQLSIEEIETQLSVMQRKMHDVKSKFSNIDVIKMHCIKEVMINNMYVSMHAYMYENTNNLPTLNQ